MKKSWGALTLVVGIAVTGSIEAQSFSQWLKVEESRALSGMLRNISPPDGVPGSVIASPSRENPDYYYHWIRDAALVMNTLVKNYHRTKDPETQQKILSRLYQYAAFSRHNQFSATHLGEPKFHVDGRPYTGRWGRPQNDGPALRALTLIGFAKILIARGETDYVRTQLYDNDSANRSIIKTDLEFVASHWPEKNFDLWEEVFADHFYTRLVQRAALLAGAELAVALDDPFAADEYRKQAKFIGQTLLQHWNPVHRRIFISLNEDKRKDQKSKNVPERKPTGLDSATILAVLHAENGDGFFGPADDRVISTAAQVKSVFKQIYPINQQEGLPGVAIGRYPEDTYDGMRTDSEGNPWFLATLGFAEYYYRLADVLNKREAIVISTFNHFFFQEVVRADALEPGQRIANSDPLFGRIIQGLKNEGDSFMRRVAIHTNQETGQMSEQMNRHTGIMQGARDLTWSYAAYLTAFWARP